MNYTVDWNRFVNWLLPAVLRKPILTAWLKAVVSPVQFLHTRFVQWAGDQRIEIQITGQVRSLEYHLNRVFYPGHPANEDIYITDGQGGDPVFIFLENENMPVYLPVFLTKPAPDFIVHAPISLFENGREMDMRSFINRYKLPGKQYEIYFDIIDQ